MRGDLVLVLGWAVVLAACEPIVLDMSHETSASNVFHSAGYAAPNVHGLALNMSELNCVSCHGHDLRGSSSAPTCDGCHAQGWKSDCTFCHGGTDNTTGAPPRELDGATAAGELRFRAHTAHVESTLSAPLECHQCHVTPADALTPGHMLDSTPAVAEVVFDRGLSAGGNYDGAGTCSSLYCHGDGRGANGAASHDEAGMTCQSCHAGPASAEHPKHLDINTITCSECHAGVVASSDTIVGPTLHIDGAVDVQFLEPGITRNGLRCTGACHAFNHEDENWN